MMAPLLPPAPKSWGRGFCAARAHTSRPAFVKITNPRKFLIEFFVQFAILHFPAIGGILSSRGERNAKTNLEAFDLQARLLALWHCDLGQ
jgi:hypothetical protein